MDNWYYIDGSQQIGPVSETMLRGLFEQNEISLETYVWKKGFPEWLRFKNVQELQSSESEDFFLDNDNPHSEDSSDEYLLEEIDLTQNNATEEIGDVEDFHLDNLSAFDFKEHVETTPNPEEDFDLDFSWKIVSDTDEIFFLKIGRDRHEKHSRIYGPYTLVELRSAFEQKRINSETLLIAPGMKSWVKIHNTPINELFFDNDNLIVELEEKPVIALINNGEFDLVGIVKDVKYPHFKISCSKDMSDFKNKEIKTSFFLGNEMKYKNISIRIEDVDLFLQEANCTNLEENSEIREFLLKSDF